MTSPTINDILSDREIDDLRHRYKNDPDVSRIIGCLIYHRGKPDESQQELDDLRMRAVTAESAETCMSGTIKRMSDMLHAWMIYHDNPKEVKRIDERTRELLREDGTP